MCPLRQTTAMRTDRRSSGVCATAWSSYEWLDVLRANEVTPRPKFDELVYALIVRDSQRAISEGYQRVQ